MKILVTGSEGGIGRRLVPTLLTAGYEVKTFDQMTSGVGHTEHQVGDIRDLAAVTKAVGGVDAVIHLSAIAGDVAGRETEVFTVNVLGTWNVLWAAKDVNVKRVIYFSSVNALGRIGGYGHPQSFPVNDTVVPEPQTPYQVSKHLAEETCRAFTTRYDLMTICLRPVLVVYPEQHYLRWRSQANEVRIEAGKADYWAYVDVRDVCQAVRLSLLVQGIRHDGFLLSAHDQMTGVPTKELVARFFPHVPWNIRKEVEDETSYHSLVDCSRAHAHLGWLPQYAWQD
jgi:UDP-glucose 4-epimerase